jgi:hypothetical protein
MVRGKSGGLSTAGWPPEYLEAPDRPKGKSDRHCGGRCAAIRPVNATSDSSGAGGRPRLTRVTGLAWAA